MSLLESLLSPGTMVRLGWMLVHVLWQATAVAVLLAVFLRLLRPAGARVRYAVACAALALMVVLPLVTLPFIEVPGPVAEAGPPPATVVLPPPTADIAAAGGERDTSVEYWNDGTMGERSADSPTFQYSSIPSFPSSPIPLRERIVSALEPALPYVVLGWLIGVFGLSAWHLGGWTQLQRLKRRMVREIGAPLHRKLEELTLRLGVHRAVGLLESALVEVPTVVGWLRPVILLPASALTGLRPEQLEAILAHELAHIRRYDYLVNMLQTVVEILGFYHPAVWWVSHRIRIERENCCDDLAVQVCGNSLQYARALASMEEIRHNAGDLAVAATGGSLMARIARLLGRPAVEDRRFAWLPGLLALLLVVGIVLPAALVLGTPRALQTIEPVATPVTNADLSATAPNVVPAEAEGGSTPADGEGAQVLLEFRIAKVAADLRPDRALLQQMAQALGEQSPLALALRQPGQALDITLDEVFRKYIVPQPLSEQAFQAMMHLLQSQSGTGILSAPRVLTRDGVPAEVRIGSELSLPLSAPSAQPVRIQYGTVINAAPHVLDANRVALKLMAEISDLVPKPDANQPTVARTSAQTNVTAMNDRYLVWAAMEPTTPTTGPEAKRHSVYIMVKPHINLPPRGLASAAAEPEPPGVPPRQVLLEVRTVAMERSALGTLNILWDQSSGRRTGYAPDQTFTDSVLPMLDLLQQNHQADISSQQILTQDHNQSRIKNIKEEWFTAAAGIGKESTVSDAEARKIDSGTTLTFRPHVSRANILRLEININTAVPRPPEPGSDLPTRATRETQTTIAINDGGTVALAGFGANSDSLDNASTRETVLFVTAHLIGDDGDTALPASPSAGATTSAPSANGEAAQVLLDFKIAKIAADLRPDRETLLLLANVLGVESPLARELAQSGRRLDMTLGEILKRYVAPRSLSQPAAEALVELLQSRGYLKMQTNSRIAPGDNKQARIRVTPAERLWMPPGSSQPERIAYGMAVDVTPHIMDGSRVALDLMVELTDPVPGVEDSNRPKVLRTSAETSMIAPNDRYLVWAALEQTAGQMEADKDRQSLYIMVKPQILQPAPGHAGPADSRKSTEEPPRQVLLDVRTVTMEHSGLLNLGVEWSWPKIQAGVFSDPSVGTPSPAADGKWPYGVQIGYTPDHQFTDSLLNALDLLRENGQARISGQQILAQEGHQSRIKALTEEWYAVTAPASQPSPPAPTKSYKTEAGTVVTITPYVGGNGDITLQTAVEVSTSQPKAGGSDLPLLTRRTAKNAVTIRDGGTVALAGLTENRAGSNDKSVRELAIFVTAHLVNDTEETTLPAPPPAEPRTQESHGTTGKGRTEAILTATFANTDLVAVLVEISRRTGVQITHDATVKPMSVTAQLVEASPETALQQVLKNTPYTFRKSDDGTYLVFRPLSKRFAGVELTTALQDVAASAGVPVIADPNVMGAVNVAFENVTLDEAMEMLLAGKPYVFKKTPDYYLIADHRPPSRAAAGTEGADRVRPGATISPEQRMMLRQQYANSDPIVHEVAKRIVKTERELIILQQTLASDHPTVVQKNALLEALRKELDRKRAELEQQFDAGLAARLGPSGRTPPDAKTGMTMPEQAASLRREYVNSDPMVQVLSKNIVETERELILLRQTLASDHPSVIQKIELLKALRGKLHETCAECQEKFDCGLAERLGPASDRSSTEPTITATFANTDLLAALTEISQRAGVPIIADPNVAGRVNVILENVTLDEALELLLAGKPYVFKRYPGYYLVADRGIVGRTTFTDISEIRRVRLNQMSAARAKGFLSPVYAPYVQVESAEGSDPNDQGRILTVTAPAAMADRIVADLQQIDRYKRQVLLDARVVVMERGDLLNLGVEWSRPKVQAGAFTDRAVDPNAGTVSNGWPWGLQIGYAPDRTFTDSLMMALNPLQENGKADIIANPKVIALDGRQAEIRTIQEEWFMMLGDQNHSSGNTTTHLQKIDSGTVLKITPHIGDNNDITLQIAVEVSDIIPKARGSDLPLVTRRTMKSAVTIKDGGTVAMSGLTKNRSKRVPYLGDLPLIGKLFQNSGNNKANREVVVFITAHLLPDTARAPLQAATPVETRTQIEKTVRSAGMEPTPTADQQSQVTDASAAAANAPAALPRRAAFEDGDPAVFPQAPGEEAMTRLLSPWWSEPWGEAVEGVQIRLRAARRQWRADEIPVLRWDVQNTGTRQYLCVLANPSGAQLEVDGVWYMWPMFLHGGRLADLGVGQSLENQFVPLSPMWSQANPEDLQPRGHDGTWIRDPMQTQPSLQLTPGKHTIRLAVIVEPSRVDTGDAFRVVSPPIEITIAPHEAGRIASWPPGPALAQAVKEAILGVIRFLPQSLHPEQPGMKEQIAEALAKAECAAALAANTPLETSVRQMAQALAVLQKAFDKDPAAGNRDEFEAVGRAYSRLVNVFSGKSRPVPPARKAADNQLASETRRVRLNWISAMRAKSLLSPVFAPYVRAESAEGLDPNDQGRILTVTAPAAMADRIVADLQQIDCYKRRVLLDARVVVMETGEIQNLGIQWIPAHPLDDLARRDDNAGKNTISNARMGIIPDRASTNSLMMTLNMLQENSKADILAHPEIVTQDGRRAEMQIVQEEWPFLDTRTKEDRDSTALIGKAMAGTFLALTAHVGDNNDIALAVAVKVSDTKIPHKGSQQVAMQHVPAGSITLRDGDRIALAELADTIWRMPAGAATLQDGGTMVLAGLVKTQSAQSDRRVPVLSDLPLVGNPFRTRNTNEPTRELVVFVTAHLIPDGRPNR